MPSAQFAAEHGLRTNTMQMMAAVLSDVPSSSPPSSSFNLTPEAGAVGASAELQAAALAAAAAVEGKAPRPRPTETTTTAAPKPITPAAPQPASASAGAMGNESLAQAPAGGGAPARARPERKRPPKRKEPEAAAATNDLVARLPSTTSVGSVLLLAVLLAAAFGLWKWRQHSAAETDIGGGRVVELPQGGEITRRSGPVGDASATRTAEILEQGVLEAVHVDKLGGSGVEGALVTLYGNDLKLVSRPHRMGAELAFMATGTLSVAGQPPMPTRLRVVEHETEAWILAAAGDNGFPDSDVATAFLRSFNLK